MKKIQTLFMILIVFVGLALISNPVQAQAKNKSAKQPSTQTTEYNQQLQAYNAEKLQFKTDYPNSTSVQRSSFVAEMRIKYPLVFKNNN